MSKEVMKEHIIICPNIPIGSNFCSWEDKWEKLESHSKVCEYALIMCRKSPKKISY